MNCPIVTEFLHTYGVGVNAILNWKFKQTISLEAYDNKSGYRRDNKTHWGYNNGDLRVVKMENTIRIKCETIGQER